MFFEGSRDEVLRMWLRAAEEFCQSSAPNVGKFAALTGRVSAHGDLREELALAVHVIEEIAGARSTTKPDKVDRVLLRSSTITASIWGHSQSLLQECVQTHAITCEEDGERRLDSISMTIERRRRAFGLKGRGYSFE